MRSSSLVSSSSGFEASKIAAQIGRALHQILVPPDVLIDHERHGASIFRLPRQIASSAAAVSAMLA
jgi:hypothetical protein